MRVLVGCECSGLVREAFREMGHDAWSCDLKEPEDGSEFHIQADVVRTVYEGRWDMIIVHPPCTYLASSGWHWTVRQPGRKAKAAKSMHLVRSLLSAPVRRIALENPVGRISTEVRPPDQIIQPYEFGDDASKQTCLWLKNLPRLVGTNYVEPRMVDGYPRWSNQLDSGQNREPDSRGRDTERSRTYPGIAAAMAAQWGNLT